MAVTELVRLRECTEAWEELAAHAVEPNVFYEPWMLLAALDCLGPPERPLFLLVWSEDGGGRRLLGLFPFEQRRRYRGLPLRHLTLWEYAYCFLCTPLLRKGHEREATAAVFAWLSRERLAPVVEWKMIGLDGPFFRGLSDVVNRRDAPFLLTQSWNRALLERRADGEAYLQETLPGRSRKEFRRLERRLSELGRLEVVLPGPADTEAWIDAFLELEAKGWKGERGTALGSTAEGRGYFARVAGAAAAAGRLMMLGLHLDGRPLALKCNFLAAEGSFAFKIAFDESHARFSPGVLLELENIRRFHDREELRWMDSCAAPEHFMANRLWMERRTLGTLLTAAGGFPGDLIVSSLPLLRWLSKTLRGGRSKGEERGPVEDRTGEGGEP